MPNINPGRNTGQKEDEQAMKRMEVLTSKRAIGFLCVSVIAAYGVITWASPAVGVTPRLIGRGTYQKFKVHTGERDFKEHDSKEHDEDGEVPFHYSAQAKPAIDMIVQTHDYAAGSSTGWHTHPGPVFITVTEGALTFYEVDDPSCTPKVVFAGEGYVDSGHGHIGRNETGSPAKDVTVAIASVGGAFRSELPAPGQ